MEIRLQEAVPVSAIPKLIKLADKICTLLPRCDQEAVTDLKAALIRVKWLEITTSK